MTRSDQTAFPPRLTDTERRAQHRAAMRAPVRRRTDAEPEDWSRDWPVSGSVLVASVAHAVWNAIAYGLFAFGSKVGALGVTETGTYGPEVGWVGLLLNAVFAAALWSCLGRSRAHLQVGARV